MKGVSSLVSLVIYTAIMVAGIAIVTNVALPVLDNMQDSSAIQDSIKFLNGMEGVINEVAAGTEGASRTVTLTFQRGSYRFDNATGELYYRIETQSSIVSSHAVQERGPLKISADADVSVTETQVDGTDCYMMENEHLKACIRKVEDGSVDTSDMLVQLRNKELDEDLNSTLTTFINGNSSLQSGTGSTEAGTGDGLGRGRVTLNVTSHGVTYRVAYDLLNGADFLTLRTSGTETDNATHILDMVLDSRTGDDTYIDGEQRGEGRYTGDEVDFGYAVGESGGRVAGLVPGGEFDSVGFDADTGEGFYGFNLTTSHDTVFLPFTEGDHGVIEDRQNEIQGDIFGAGNFLGFPSPNFAYGLSQEKTVKVAISFDNVVLGGFDRALHQGTYDITVKNTDVQDGQAVVNLTVD